MRTAGRTSSSTPCSTAFFGLAALAAWTSIRDAIGAELRRNHRRRAGSVGSAAAERLVVIEAPAIAVLALGVAAAATDITTRRIPNALTFGAAAVGGGVRCGHGRRSGTRMERGWLDGRPVVVPAAVRACVRWAAATSSCSRRSAPGWVRCWCSGWRSTAPSPAACSRCCCVVWRGGCSATIANMWAIVTHWRRSGLKPHPVVTLDNPGAVRMPYALPIALGALATLWLRVW